jgi:uncharacterized Zn finger protein
MDQFNGNIKDTQAISCDKCKSEVFSEGVILRKASRFVTGTPKDAIIPIPVFRCASCGHLNDEFIPKMLKGE